MLIVAVAALFRDILDRHIGGGQQHFGACGAAGDQILNECHAELLFIMVLESGSAHIHLMGSTVHRPVQIRHTIYFIADDKQLFVMGAIGELRILMELFADLVAHQPEVMPDRI